MKKSGLLFVGLVGVAVMLGFNNVSASCDEDFYGTLRHNKQYTFGDDFHANSSDKWIQKASGVFSEQYDYNRGSNPSFGWTDAIKTAKGKVSKNTTMSVLVANAKYPILDVPASRSYDNLLVTYTITYSTDSEGKNKYVHTECKHYEISRCGDGVLDSVYETCDPNDSTHAGWGDNGCDASCKPIAAKDPVCSSTYKGTKYTTSSDHWLKSTDNLCDEGEVVDFSYTPATGGPRSYEWNCKSGSKKTNPKCSAKQQWCGDGEKNGSETCDPNDSTHAGWGDNGCDASCKPIAAKDPVCSSTYKGTKYTTSSDHWLKSTDNLCDEGKVVDFSYTPATGGPRTYTWNCESGSKKTDPKCSAKQQWCGDGEKNGSETCDPNDSTQAGWGKDGCDNSCNPINNPEGGTLNTEKTLISESKYVTKVGQEMVWQIKVTAEKGDVNNVKIKDYLPEVLTYVSYEKTLPSGVTMNAGQPTVGTDSTGNYLQWETTGTLKEGKSIILVVTTKVNKMPKLSDNYNNVACAKAEGVTEDCDKKPVEKGYLEPEKTLVGAKKEITEVGQAVVWNLKATAKGGDVENPVIRDVLPPVLGYSGYMVTESAGLTVNKPTTGTIITGGETLETVEWKTVGTLKENEYIIIQLTTYAKKMPERDYKNVLCVRPENVPDDEKCDDVPVPSPKLWIKKSFTDGSKKKTVKINEEIAYKISFGNSGDASATITSIKDFLPKNVEYVTGSITINGSTHSNQSAGSEVINTNTTVDGVYVDIYGGITLNPGDSGYIILTGKVLNEHLDTTKQNWACIYLNDKKPDDDIIDGDWCDWAEHEIGEPSCKPTLNPSSFGNVNCSDTSTFTTTVTCNSTGGKADIEIICEGTVVNTGYVEQLTGTCSSNVNSTDHKVQCKINGSLVGANGEACEASFRRDCTNPGSSCFVAGTKVTMADGTKKNIEDIEIGEKILGQDGSINTVLGYDRPALGNRHLWSINGGEYFVSDEHPFMTTYGWKSFNPEMTKLEIDLNTTKLNIGDKIITENGEEEVKSVDYVNRDASTQLYNFILDGNHTYYANNYLVHNKGGGSCFVAGTKVIMADGSIKNIEDVKVGEKIKGENGINTVLGYDRPILRSRHLWSINGGEYFVSDEHPFKTLQGWKSFNPEMTKLEIDLNTTELNVGDILITKDGLEMVNAVDYIDADYNTQLYNFVLDGDNTYYANNYLVHNKGGGPTPDPEIYDSVNCFNVNAGNISIQTGEILPFYWNIEKLSSVVEKGGYVTYDGNKYPYGNESNYDNIIKNGTCTSDDDGNIALNSMMCSFEIRDGAGNPVKTGKYPCLDKPGDISEPLLRAWKNWSIGKYTVGSDGKTKKLRNLDTINDKNYIFRANVNYIPNFGANASIFGEYKIALTKVEFAQCQDKKWVDGKISPIECQSNFVLTNPYTVQKTPSGNLKASTTILNKYKYMDGKAVMSELLNAITVSEYEPNNAVSEAMKTFKNKYQKLAVSVGNGMKKVPGKNIYFIEGDKTIKNGQFNKPFTFIQTNANSTITIEGSITNLNMMVLTEGKIRFKGVDTCNKRQVVKGVFYAGQGLSRDAVQKNTSISNNAWCTEGGLTVKGVLIGKGLQGMMDNSRSNLNGWFETTDKKGTVMNGASVLIEYSPSVFTKSTMPPGAEDFTTALSIYKN